MPDYEDRDPESAAGSDDDNDDDEDDVLYNQDSAAQQQLKLFREAQSSIRELFREVQSLIREYSDDAQKAAREQKIATLVQKGIHTFTTSCWSVFGQTIEDPLTPTLLHSVVHLAKHYGVSSTHVQPLLERIVKDFPGSLKVPNDKGENPLYLAIGYKKWMIVEYMIDACSNQRALADAIASPCKNEDNKTSLHLALEKDFRPQVTKKLLGFASDEALGKTDVMGKTPLHYAVTYSQCSNSRAEIIDMFVDRDEQLVARLKENNPNEPVETFLDKVDNNDLSVYRQHQETAAAYVPPKVSKLKTEDTKKAAGSVLPEDRDLPLALQRPDPRAADRLKGTKTHSDRVSRGRLRDEGRERGVDRGERAGAGQEDKKLDEREELRRQRREQEAREREARERAPHEILVADPWADTRALLDQADDRYRDRRRPDLEHVREILDATADDFLQQNKRGPVEAIRSESLPRVVTNGAHVSTEHSPNTPLKRVGTGRFDGGEDSKKMKPTAAASSSKKKSDKPDPKTLARNSDRILTRLKLHYVRTRNTERATAFLYGKNVEGIQICFEYNGLPEEVREDVFIKSFGADHTSGIKFDKVLRYVSFPKVKVKRTPGRNAPKDTGASGRRDMQFFFEWLYKKGVRHIIRVNVDDTSSPAHSDEAIQKSLERIVVEQLNWHKIDLDPRTICRTGTKVEQDASKQVSNQLVEVSLRWSGNNAVLRSWSEPEGLPLLPRLLKVNLYMPALTETYDSKQWIDNNVQEFQERLDKNISVTRASLNTSERSNSKESKSSDKTGTDSENTPEQNRVEVFQVHGGTGKSQKVHSKSGDNSDAPASSGHVVTSHKWLDCMDLFAGKFKPFWDQTLKEFVESRGERAKKTEEGVEDDVVIGLIDDGVDSCDDVLAGQILDGKTFDYQEDSMGPHFVSAKGHGTVMASMITRVCPMTKIYPIRLKTQTGPDQQPQIVVRSAALAIQAALDKGATIISMSWTIPITDENDEDKVFLATVLDRAVKSNALMFCSSPDGGKFTEVDYPTAHNRERFFRIGAAEDNGTPYRLAGPIDSLDFILPGVDVVRNHSSKRLADKVKEVQWETGSSVATALAAGLAATIIYCVKACALAMLTANANKGGDESEQLKIIPSGEVERIAEHVNMKKAFAKLGTVTDSRFIQVWETLDPVNEVFKNDFAPPKQKLESLIALATKLIPIRR